MSLNLERGGFIRKSRMEKYFAEITKYVSKSGITFYIMPRINGVGVYGEDWLLDYLYMNDAYAYYFIQNNFNDFHDYNFGVKCGHPVIIDYAWNYL